MCGIFCIIKTPGKHKPSELFQSMVEGLSSLQYRGYDSWGLAYSYKTKENNQLVYIKSIEKEISIDNSIDFGIKCIEESGIIIGHTRWADSGPPNIKNTHPIHGGNYEVLLIHNGTISNAQEIKNKLQNNFKFETDTDTESIAHLVADEFRKIDIYDYFDNGPYSFLKNINDKLEGTWAFCFIHEQFPNHIFFSVNKSSLFIHEDGYISSDLNSLPDGGYYKLNDGEFGYACNFTGKQKNVYFIIFNSRETQPIEILWNIKRTPCLNTGEFIINDRATPKMWQEIISQPHLISNFDDSKLFKKITIFGRNMTFFGCGSSYNAALLSKLYFKDNNWMIPEVQYASEFNFYDSGYLDRYFFPISQSGETLDVISTIKELKNIINKDKFKSKICSVTNNNNSSISLLSDDILDIQAGPELSVAATKSFTMTCFALYCQSMKNKNKIHRDNLVKAISDVLLLSNDIKQIVSEIFHYKNALYLSSGYGYPIAREGALKLKEISYVHAEAMPAAEVKHGSIALIDDTLFSVFIINDTERIERITANISQVKARCGRILLVTDKSNPSVYNKDVAWSVITPSVDRQLQPLVNNVVLQLLAYYMAIKKNCDVDRPRSLAKSITVH